MPDLLSGVAYPEDDIAQLDLRQVIYLASGICLVAEEEGTDHAGVPSVAVGTVDVVTPHEFSAFSAGGGVFVGVWTELGIIPGGTSWPFHDKTLSLFTEYQFLIHRVEISSL